MRGTRRGGAGLRTIRSHTQATFAGMETRRDAMGRTEGDVYALKLAARSYPVTLRTDSPDDAEPIVCALFEWGFRRIVVEPLANANAVPCVHAGAIANRSDTLLAEVFGAVGTTVLDVSFDTINHVDFAPLEDGDHRILIDLPTKALRDGSLLPWLDALQASVA